MTTGRALIGLVPWLVAGVAVLAFPILMGPAGLLYSAGWTLVLIAARGWTAEQPRSGRVWSDCLLGAVCLFGAYLGGWYLLPSIAAFLLVDVAGVESPVVHLRTRQRWEVVAALSTLCAGVAGLAYLLLGGPYSSASSSVGVNGAVTNGPVNTLDFLAVNGGRGVVVAIIAASLIAAVAVGALLHTAGGRRSTRLLTGAGAVGLVLLTVIGSVSFGPWLAPSAVLATLTWFAGRTISSSREAIRSRSRGG